MCRRIFRANCDLDGLIQIHPSVNNENFSDIDRLGGRIAVNQTRNCVEENGAADPPAGALQLRDCWGYSSLCTADARA